MSNFYSKCESDFTIEGRFLGFTAKDGYKLKYLRLSTGAGDVIVKIAKDLRSTLWRTLTPGEWIRVSGTQKHNEGNGQTKWKAYQVLVTTPGHCRDEQPLPVPNPQAAPSAKASILVCQKSDCCQRGGTAVTQALYQALSDRHLTDHVTIKGTGCMKRCKAGPNLVMPDKTRYSGIRAEAIPALIDQHFQLVRG